MVGDHDGDGDGVIAGGRWTGRGPLYLWIVTSKYFLVQIPDGSWVLAQIPSPELLALLNRSSLSVFHLADGTTDNSKAL